jgi:hypothetical protein
MINPAIAHLTAANGTQYQVLAEDGDDWDEAATSAAYEAAWVPAGVPVEVEPSALT